MNISDETRHSLVRDLSETELRDELRRRESRSFGLSTPGGGHVFLRKLDACEVNDNQTVHLLAGHGEVVWLRPEDVRKLRDAMDRMLDD